MEALRQRFVGHIVRRRRRAPRVLLLDVPSGVRARSIGNRMTSLIAARDPVRRALHSRSPLPSHHAGEGPMVCTTQPEGDVLAFYREINNLIWQPGLSARTEFKGLFRTLANPALRHYEPPDAGRWFCGLGRRLQALLESA